MTKTKYWYLIGGTAGLIVVTGIGWKILRGGHTRHSSQGAKSVQGAYTEQPLSHTTDPNSVSLTQTQNKSSGGLSVAPNSTENNLGQLTPNSSGSNTNNTSSKSQAAAEPDPATFSQYDKYKESEGALFGDLQIGNGAELTAGKKAAVYYKGWLTNGQLFDMTRADKDGKLQPFVFAMGEHQVIAGWEQGLMGMKVGGTRLVIVPPAVGYGAAGQPPIPGNAVLVFEVQLLAVE